MIIIEMRLEYDNTSRVTQWMRIIRPTKKLAVARLKLYQSLEGWNKATVHYTISDRKGRIVGAFGSLKSPSSTWYYDVSYYH